MGYYIIFKVGPVLGLTSSGGRLDFFKARKITNIMSICTLNERYNIGNL